MKTISLFLAALLIWNSAALAAPTSTASRSPQTQSQKDQQTAKAESAVRKRGTGEKSRVRVTRTDGSKVKGYISKIEESSFTVTDKKTGQATTISFAEVQKMQGAGLSTGNKVLIGVGIGLAAAAIIIGVIAYKVTHN